MKIDQQKYQTYFNSHVKIDDNGCHRWVAGKNNIGYGMFRYDGKMRTVHRLMMEWEGHNIVGKVVYHSCDNYDCVNPDHLNVGTIKEKNQLMSEKGRSGIFWSDPKYYQTCQHCGYHGSPAVVAHYHNEKCAQKP